MFFPYENITYKTKLDSKEILERINDIIEPKVYFRTRDNFYINENEPYEGSIRDNSFKINRIPDYNNTFLPIINGQIEKKFNKTNVIIKMRLSKLALVYILFWLGSIVYVFYSSFIINATEQSDSIIFILFFMLLVSYIYVTGSFKYESRESKKMLEFLLEVESE